MKLKDGIPCKHSGCLNHVTKPCDGCGRVNGKEDSMGKDKQWSDVSDLEKERDNLQEVSNIHRDIAKAWAKQAGEHKSALEALQNVFQLKMEDYKDVTKENYRLIAALNSMPQIMRETLLETTAWLGIPEKKREAYIAEHVSNIQFIVNKELK